MARFIELFEWKSTGNPEPFLVNVDAIRDVRATTVATGANAQVTFPNGTALNVVETYADLVAKLGS